MSRTYRDPRDYIEYDPPEFRIRIRCGLLPSPIGGPLDPFSENYGLKGKRAIKRLYSHMRRRQGKAVIRNEIRMMHDLPPYQKG